MLFLRYAAGHVWVGVSGFAHHSLDGFDAIYQCMHHFVGMFVGGMGDMFLLKLDRVG